MGFPRGSDGKGSAYNARDAGLIPGLGRSPGEGNGYPRQYPCLENSMDRGAWWATVHRVAKKSDTTWQLNNNYTHTHTHTHTYVAYKYVIKLFIFASILYNSFNKHFQGVHSYEVLPGQKAQREDPRFWVAREDKIYLEIIITYNIKKQGWML